MGKKSSRMIFFLLFSRGNISIITSGALIIGGKLCFFPVV
jgi:hypothetical protein